jgi:hypothetical protein
MTTQSKSLRLADQLAASPYAWPGGYPLHAVTTDGAALCKHCAKTERESIATTAGSDGWCVTALDVNYENPQLYCDHCGERIESAYAEPPEPVLVLNDSHGVYIPQLWCSDLTEADIKRIGLNPWDVQQCQAGPDSEHYWCAWDSILNDAEMVDDKGVTWRLHQDGDLWEVADGYQWEAA